jgi:hypothetical protein
MRLNQSKSTLCGHSDKDPVRWTSHGAQRVLCNELHSEWLDSFLSSSCVNRGRLFPQTPPPKRWSYKAARTYRVLRKEAMSRRGEEK